MKSEKKSIDIKTWDDFDFFDSAEFGIIEDRLDELDRKGIRYNPKRENIFASLDAVPFDHVSVAIIGQDPYPQADCATGVAFSIPSSQKKFPPTLVNILREYMEDLHYDFPSSGDLTPWCQQGVLLYNCIPTCYTGKPCSHRDWNEWNFLTKEIIFRLSRRGCLFASLGGIARLALEEQGVEGLSYSHPSPLGVDKTSHPFRGSRLFSTINSKLPKGKRIDWRLP